MWTRNKILFISELSPAFPQILQYCTMDGDLVQVQFQLLLNLNLPLWRVSCNIKKIPSEAVFYLFISGSHELAENVLCFVPSSQFDKLSRVKITLASYLFLESPAECKIWLSCSLNKALNVPWDVTVHRNGIQCSAC